MSEENRSTITYDDNWKNVSETEYANTYDYSEEKSELYENNFDKSNWEQEPQKFKKPKDDTHQYLITIQLIICILIAIIAFFLKNSDSEVYHTAKEWYFSNLNNSVIFENNNFDLKSMLGLSTKDEG
ncbi:MAG: hypothetical protein MJ089_00200 [Ruminococcus sp.]|nr:hypothetical protein [Ruminococcus sp.]